LRQLLHFSVPPADIDARVDRVTSAFLDALHNLYLAERNLSKVVPPSLALAALFDLAMTAQFSRRRKRNGSLGPFLSCSNQFVSPFLKMCPLCSARTRTPTYVEFDELKPESAVIGQAGEISLMSILRTVRKFTGSDLHFDKINDREKKYELIFYNRNLFILAETKASAMVCFPMIASGPPSQRGHELTSLPTASISETSILLPHTGKAILLGQPSDPHWPFKSLTEHFAEPANVKDYLLAWKEIFDVRRQSSSENQNDWRRYLSYGCGKWKGKNIDDSKNLPGFDRTDDIKKGTYQILWYSTMWKVRCKLGAVRSVLLGNSYAERHREYVEDLLKAKILVPDESGQERVYNIFDAAVGLTRNVFNDSEVARHFDFGMIAGGA